MTLVASILLGLLLVAALTAVAGLLWFISIFHDYEQGRAQRARHFEQEAWVLGVRSRKINPMAKPSPKYQAERASEAVQAVLRG